MNTRRKFLIQAPLSILVATAGLKNGNSQTPSQTPTTPGAPPTFGTGAGVGPAVTPHTFEEAEKLMQVTMTAAERQQAADSWRALMAPYLERRTGPRKVEIAPGDSPAVLWNSAMPGVPVTNPADRFVGSKADAAAPSTRDEDIAFVPVTQLSRWIESRK